MLTPDPWLCSALMELFEADFKAASQSNSPANRGAAWDEVKMLLESGSEVNGWYEGRTLLSHAVGWQRPDVVELLLDHGARIDEQVSAPGSHYPADTVATEAYDPEMVRLLVRRGANILDFDRDMLPFATGADRVPEQRIDPSATQLAPVQRGNRNPQPCDNPFYIEQIRSFESAYAGMKRHFGEEATSYRYPHSPIFSFQRFGRTITNLPDGRLVFIAGEHEDFYDADFCIYNDVCVLDQNGGVELFVYPESDFPPTDFHSATLIDDNIFIIGNLGYQGQRPEGVTQVLRLEIDSWRVTPVQTVGDNPGWIRNHEAEHVDGEILISGGVIEPGNRAVNNSYALNLQNMTWREMS